MSSIKLQIIQSIGSISKSFYKQCKAILACHTSFFFEHSFFCFIDFTGCFAFSLDLFSSDLIWFWLSLSCWSFLLKKRLVMILNFSPHRFVRLTNLRTFSKKQLATLIWIFSSLPVLVINSLKKVSQKNKFAPNRKVFHYQYLLQLLKKELSNFLQSIYPQKKHKNIYFPEVYPIWSYFIHKK